MRALPGRPPTPRSLNDYLAAHPHAFTRAELLSAWSPRRLRTGLDEGLVARILPGIYCLAKFARDPLVMGEALNLWHPRGLVTGALALHLYVPTLPAPLIADLMVDKGQHLRAPSWVRLRQVRTTPAHGLPQGVACAVPGIALLDAWHCAPALERSTLLYEALWARVCTWRELAREVERTKRVSGRRDLERLLGWFAEGATSPLEVRAKHETFADARFREFEWQVDLRLGSRRATVDMLHRAAMVVVELDGDRYHSTRAARSDDRERQTDLAAAGYVVVRFGWDDVVRRPGWCREQVLRVVEGRFTRSRST